MAENWEWKIGARRFEAKDWEWKFGAENLRWKIGAANHFKIFHHNFSPGKYFTQNFDIFLFFTRNQCS